MHTLERRRFKRIFLSDDDGIAAFLKRSPDSEDPIKSKVMNLSEGGLFVTVGKDTEFRGLIKGVRLTLSEIRSGDLHINAQDTQIEVKWYIDDQFLNHIGIGFEFIGLDKSVKEQILDFISSLALESLSN